MKFLTLTTIFCAILVLSLIGVDVIAGVHEVEHARTASPSTLEGVGKGKVVMLDYYYNNERRSGPNGKSVRYHYVWEDTANSGFSDLGKMIVGLGAGLDTLNVAPTAKSLEGASIYIIVDPDTPAESPDPHYIEAPASTVIVEWVHAGGILLLLGNDKGNAEFEHLNRLAENFGIHFNEDSRNHVDGNKYEMGAFTRFPANPLFKGVKKIYIKELSTLKLSGSATSLLTDKGDVIIGSSKFGKGQVIAVGDPWFYNEYYGHRKLPAGFENDKAAQNLFRWLLKTAHAVKR
ncbi:MAG TPA: hypothetical protein VMM58_06340 [Bacteroidota bacterium]|nr:hypothetical protein [Bacteroidota bacterium]